MANVKISALHKRFGGVHAVRGIDLDIPDGEFTVLVGPSGCGKSTLLRTIAGPGGYRRRQHRDRRASGEPHAAARPGCGHGVPGLCPVSPHDRRGQHLSEPARAAIAKPEIEERVKRAAEMLGIGPLLGRYPRQLSGGQRQRVAIGRAIVRNPRVFLFDEPLSNLDAQLRDEMRSEIKRCTKRSRRP